MIFDVATSPITEYRDAMPEDGFKKRFSWKPADPKSVKWVWHDKTPFPWDRVIKHGASSGEHYASAHDQLNAAQRVAQSLNLKGRDYDPDTDEHMVAKTTRGPTGERIIKAVQAAIDKLGI